MGAAMCAGPALARDENLNLAAMRKDYLGIPEEAVFLERARILDEAGRKYAGLPAGVRQGRAFQDLCRQVTPRVYPDDVLLSRVREQVPTEEEEAFIRARPELFIHPGVRPWFESASIYVPDWGHLLQIGIGGLIEEVESARPNATPAAQDTLDGIRLSLKAVSTLLTRYAAEARRVAGSADRKETVQRLRRAAEGCEAVAAAPAKGFHEALQLFLTFHMALSCLVGGRNVTPGRMDQYLLPFYERDLKAGRLSRQEAVELVAAMMLMFSQLSGAVASDWQSKKRTPNRYSHYYITLGGVKADGSSAVNALSSVFLDARRLVDFRDPALSIRYFPGIDREFWGKAVTLMRDRLPVLSYNDSAVIAAQEKLGVADELARDYANCGCLFTTLPGRDLSAARVNHNGPGAVLLAINEGVDPLTGKQVGEATPPTESLRDFESFFNAVRAQLRHSLAVATRQRGRSPGDRPLGYPLLARPLLDGCLRGATFRRNVDQDLVGVATTIDSLLAVREVVYRRKLLTLTELGVALRKNFVNYDRLHACLMNGVPTYGCDDPDVTEITQRVSKAWVADVAAAGRGSDDVLRPAFYSWLYNIELGKATGATPDGRLSGEPLSSDQTPSHGHGRAPTEALRSIAQLSHDCTCSGGTTFTISPAHFQGPRGVDRLAALIEGYFAEGGLQLHFIVADLAMLRDAVKHPERHGDLLVRVAGFSEYFVRLQPAVQQEIIRRVQQGTNE
jgi:formate C-acetyltransferase